MRRSTVRASRLSGVPSTQVDRGAPLADRNSVDYWCHADHVTSVTLDSAADVPERWECQTCGAPASRARGEAHRPARARWSPKSPFEFLMMRRTAEEGEELLAEALADMRRRRSTGQTR